MAISLVHAVSMTVADVLYQSSGQYGFLVLKEAEGERVLPVFYWGSAIVDLVELACLMRGVPFPVPMADALLLNLLDRNDITFHGVVVHSMYPLDPAWHFAYQSTALFRRDDQAVELDVRINQMIPMAVRQGQQILVFEQVLSSHGLVFPPDLQANLGVGIEHLLRNSPIPLERAVPEEDDFDTEQAHIRFEVDIAVRDLLHFSAYRTRQKQAPPRSNLQQWWASWLRRSGGARSGSSYPIPHASAELDPATRPRIASDGSQSADIAEP